eukprot:g18868.t1
MSGNGNSRRLDLNGHSFEFTFFDYSRSVARVPLRTSTPIASASSVRYLCALPTLTLSAAVHQLSRRSGFRVSVRSLRDLSSCRSSAQFSMSEEEVKRGPFRRYFYQGIEVHKLLDLSHAELMKLFPARARRRFARGSVPMHLLKRLRKAKKEAAPEEKPKTIKTHMRDMIIVPEMVASVVGVYNGKSFTQVEIKPNMIGHYLGEFSITYKPVAHAKPGGGSTKGSRFVPLS